MAERDRQTSGFITPLSNTLITFGNTRMGMDGRASAWFGPQNPLDPVAPPIVAGRQFDYLHGTNLAVRPRHTEAITFDTLRRIADSYDLLRVIIETRKDQIDKIVWNFTSRDGKSKVSPEKEKMLRRFFERPDGEHDFSTWLRMILEDLLVLDAPTLWRQRDRAGRTIALHPMDGATIKRVVDDWGRTPRAFKDESGQLVYPPAYQQILKGMTAVNYRADEIIYRPRNLRTNKLYGYSPVEQILVTVNIAMRRQLSQLQYYTEGNIPESLIGVPDTWTPDQIRAFQDYWDAYFTGDTAARRKAKFVPGGVAKTFIPVREPELKNMYDEWLARLCCFAFSISSQPFVSQVNRATAETQERQASEEGLVPLLQWVKTVLDEIILVDFGFDDVVATYEASEKQDPLVESQLLSAARDRGAISLNEYRERLGYEPDSTPEANELGLLTQTGWVPLSTERRNEIAESNPLLQQLGPDGEKKSPFDKDEEDDEKEDEKKSKESDIEKLFGPLLKDGDNDWQNQPRDNLGRFGSKGGPTARERRRAERTRAEQDPLYVRDRTGKFKAGGLSQERVKTTVKDITNKVVLAGVVTFSTYAVGKVLQNTGYGEDLRNLGKRIAKATLNDATERGLTLVLQGMGFPSSDAKRSAKFVRQTLEGMLERKRKMGKAADEETPEDLSDLLSRSGLTLLMDISRVSLPDLLDEVLDEVIAKLEASVDDEDEDKLEEISRILEQEIAEIKSAAAELEAPLERMVMTEDLAKRARPLKPIRSSSPALGRAREMLKTSVARILRAEGERIAAIVRQRLSSVRKARSTYDQMADDITRDISLNVSQDYIYDMSDGLSVASRDAARRTLVQFGVDDSADLVSRSSSRAVRWAEDHSASLLGKKVLSDGTIVLDGNSGYNLDDSTRRMISRAISKGLSDGLSEEEIVKSVQDIGFSEERASEIAENEIAEANSAGALEAYRAARQSGVRVMKSWRTVRDGCVDVEICKGNEDQGPIDVDQPFQSGHMKPLGHPRCRCSLVPVIVED